MDINKRRSSIHNTIRRLSVYGLGDSMHGLDDNEWNDLESDNRSHVIDSTNDNMTIALSETENNLHERSLNISSTLLRAIPQSAITDKELVEEDPADPFMKDTESNDIGLKQSRSAKESVVSEIQAGDSKCLALANG